MGHYVLQNSHQQKIVTFFSSFLAIVGFGQQAFALLKIPCCNSPSSRPLCCSGGVCSSSSNNAKSGDRATPT